MNKNVTCCYIHANISAYQNKSKLSQLGCRLRRTKMGKQFLKLKRWLTELDKSQIENIEVDGIDTNDYPDFCDAYISYAEYRGKPLSDGQLERLNEDADFVALCVQEKLF